MNVVQDVYAKAETMIAQTRLIQRGVVMVGTLLRYFAVLQHAIPLQLEEGVFPCVLVFSFARAEVRKDLEYILRHTIYELSSMAF